MTALLYKIFGYSFDALLDYENETKGFDDWVNDSLRVNQQVNTLVFRFLQRKNMTGAGIDSFNQQFYLDTINKTVSRHYRNRLRLYKLATTVPVLQKEIFCLTSSVLCIGQQLGRVLLSVKNLRHDFVLKDTILFDNVEICIGFPNHSFACARTINNPASFIEYLISKDENARRKNILSLDEYQRKSKQYEERVESVNENGAPMNFERTRITLDRKNQTLKQVWELARETYRSYRLRIKNGNMFLLAEYLNQSYIERRYVSLFKKLESSNIAIEKIYLLAFTEAGLLKYAPAYQELISVFSYSQNLFMPPAKQISSKLLAETTELSEQEILQECGLSVFSFYGNHPSGFTEHVNIINYFKSVICHHFGLSLPFVTGTPVSIPANIGYESFTTIETSQAIKYILVFDVPIEKTERDLGRSIIGDKTAKKTFMQNFYDDIVSLSEKYHCKIILKPKYSLSSPEFPDEYKAMIKLVQQQMGDKFMVLDPYTHIKVSDKLIDLSISFPFTSTYYSMAEISRRSIYYVPAAYSKCFAHEMEDKLVLGKDGLENIFKYL